MAETTSRSYDPATTAGRLRMMVGDVDTPFEFADDELLQFYADASSEFNGAAGLCLLAWANRMARRDNSVSMASVSRSMANPAAEMRAQAERYLDLSETVDIDTKPVVFGTARMDHRFTTSDKPRLDRQFAEEEVV